MAANTPYSNAKTAALDYLRQYGNGKVFFVDSNTTVVGGDGLRPETPCATIPLALAKCTANAGDEIRCMPGHNEGFGNATLDINVAGVTIVGLGRGSLTPRIDFDHANASINIQASNVTLRNFRLLPSVTDVLIGIDIETLNTDTLLDGIEFLPGEDGAGVDEFALGINLKVGCSRTVIKNCKFRQHASAAGVLAVVRMTGATDDITISDCDFTCAGSGLVAPINGITTLCTNVKIENCVLTCDDEPGIELLTGTTGVIRNVDIFSNLATLAAATVADGCAHFRVQNVELGNESGGVVKTASVDD